jgi:heme A synthase
MSKTRMETATDLASYPSSKPLGARAHRFAAYAWAVLVCNVLVVLWGAFVRATGSGAGCGAHWPLCNGTVMPRAPQTATIIEFAHRATSGIALLLIAVLVIWAYRSYPRGHHVRLGAALSGVFIVTEALIGAGLVLFGQVAKNPSIAHAWSLSLHLINTFTLLAVLALTAWWASGAPPVRAGNAGLLLASLAALMLLGVSGAVAALGDTLFPVTSLSAGFAQDFSPSAHIFVRLRMFHPVIAVLAAALVLYTAVRTMRGNRSARVQNMGVVLIVFVIAQIMIGVMNLTMLAPVPMQLVHLAAADAVWIVAVLFTAAALSVDEPHAIGRVA